jgi:hypothetical protein
MNSYYSWLHNCITSTSSALLSNAMCFGRVPYRTFKICFAVLLHSIVIPVYCLVLFSVNLGFILCCTHVMYQFSFGHVIQDSWIRQSVAVYPWFAENTMLQWRLCTHMVFSEYASDCCLCWTVSVVTMNMSNFRNTQHRIHTQSEPRHWKSLNTAF